jgi:hypothetical protein
MSKEKEQQYLKLCGLIVGILGVIIMVSEYLYYFFGIPRMVEDTTIGFLIGFILAQVGIDIMLMSYIARVQMEAKK